MSWDDLGGLPPQAYNASFLQKLAQDPNAVRMVGDNFVRDRLREDMVFNSIIPQTPITVDKLQKNLETDTMYELIYIDPNAAAALVDFRGPSRHRVVTSSKVPLSFHMLKSDTFEVVEQEILVYPYPIVRLIHEYAIKAIGDQHDLYMIQNCKRGVDFVDANTNYKAMWGGGSVRGLKADGTPFGTTETGPITTASLVEAKKSLTNRIEAKILLITKHDHTDLDAFDMFDMGEDLRSEVFVNGYRQPKWTGLRTVVTTKQDVFQRGNVWLFADAEFLGKNRVLDYGGNAYKLFIDRRSNVITWEVYITVGALIANVGSMAQLRLYGPNLDADPSRDPLQVTDDDLYQNRNLVSTGGKFPDIRQF